MKRSGIVALAAFAGLSFFAARPAVAQNFASVVAAGPDVVFVGEPLNEYSPGTVYAYRRDGSGRWQVAATLQASDAAPNDGFGRGLAFENGRLMVGAPAADSGRGAVYLFERDAAGAWRQTRRIAGEAPGDSLGRVVTLAGDLAIITAAGADSGRGAVLLFTAASGSWAPAGRLVADGGKPGDGFGSATATLGGLILVGAPARDSSRGAIYVFRRGPTAGTWTQDGMMPSRAIGANTRIGATLATRGDEIFVGAPGANRSAGQVYVSSRDSVTGLWALRGVLQQPFEGLNVWFGTAIAFDGNDVLVGAPGAHRFTGLVYRFTRDSAGDWISASTIGPAGLTGRLWFGGAVAVAGNHGVVGMPGDDFGAGSALFLAKEPGGTWSESPRVVSSTKGLSPIVGGKLDCARGKASIFGCQSMDLLSFLPVSAIGGKRGVELNDMWGWTDGQTGREYALVGRFDGTSFVDVTDPTHPVYLGDLPLTKGAIPNAWRDIKVYHDYAFIVADGAGNHGMQVFNLARLRDVTKAPVTFTEDAIYTRIHSAHNIVIDTATGFAYTVGNSGGGETCGGGLHMIDIHDPLHPKFAGCFADPSVGRAGTGYVHDAQCVVYHGPDARYRSREICFDAAETALSIADVTDKSHPVAVARAPYPNVGYAHQGWLTADQKYFYMDDELDELKGLTDGTRTLIWDVSKLDEPVLAGAYVSRDKATDHNLYIVGNLMYESNYVSGLRVIDISDRLHPREVGYFDTVPVGPDAPGFGGTWSNYPFFKSGTVVMTSMKEGLFMLRRHPNLVP